MIFQELVNAVVTETNRPDMDSSQGGDGQIQQKIASATLYLHTIDYFKKDIIPSQVTFDSVAFIQELDTTLLTRYRSIAYARKDDKSLVTFQQNPTLLPPLFNSVGAVNIQQSMRMFTLIPPDKIFDDNGYQSELMDVCYHAGDTLFFKSSSAFDTMLFAWYAFPNVDTTNNGANFSSWIARDFPYAITSVATSGIFTNIGKNEASRKYDGPGGLVDTWTRNLLISNVEDAGR